MPKGQLLKLLASWPAVILATFHVILCFVVDVTFAEDGWQWFLVAIVDFPASNWIKRLDHPFESFLILGTLWWYGIGVIVQLVYLALASTAKQDSK